MLDVTTSLQAMKLERPVPTPEDAASRLIFKQQVHHSAYCIGNSAWQAQERPCQPTPVLTSSLVETPAPSHSPGPCWGLRRSGGTADPSTWRAISGFAAAHFHERPPDSSLRTSAARPWAHALALTGHYLSDGATAQ